MKVSTLCLLSVCCLISMVGCTGTSPAKTMLGTWQLDTEAMQKMVEEYQQAVGVPDPGLVSDAMHRFRTARFEFTDSTLIVRHSASDDAAGNSTRAAPYNISGTDGKRVKILVGEGGSDEPMTITVIGENHLSMRRDNAHRDENFPVLLVRAGKAN